MNHDAKSEQPASKSGTQQESLRVFLANEEKFDQYDDPREATNLAADYPEVVKRLSNSGEDYWESQAALHR